MKSSLVHIECPACGQHYSMELGDEETTVTCLNCNAEFVACKVEDSDQPEAENSPVKTTPKIINKSRLVSKRPSILDRFLSFTFSFGKTFSGILAVVFLLGVLCSLIVFVYNLRSSIEVPKYDQIFSRSESDDSSRVGSKGSTDLDERREIEKQYGDKLAAIVKKFSLSDDTYDHILIVMKKLEKEYRGDYISGLKIALTDAEKSNDKKTGKPHPALEVAQQYTDAFFEAEHNVMSSKTAATQVRWTALGSALICFFMLFMMLIIPALLKIEENTRRIE